MNTIGLHILGVDAIVADKRIGQADHLAGIGRIGEQFLITRHGGIENDLTAAKLHRTGEGASPKGKTVFQGKKSFHAFPPS